MDSRGSSSNCSIGWEKVTSREEKSDLKCPERIAVETRRAVYERIRGGRRNRIAMGRTLSSPTLWKLLDLTSYQTV